MFIVHTSSTNKEIQNFKLRNPTCIKLESLQIRYWVQNPSKIEGPTGADLSMCQVDYKTKEHTTEQSDLNCGRRQIWYCQGVSSMHSRSRCTHHIWHPALHTQWVVLKEHGMSCSTTAVQHHFNAYSELNFGKRQFLFCRGVSCFMLLACMKLTQGSHLVTTTYSLSRAEVTCNDLNTYCSAVSLQSIFWPQFWKGSVISSGVASLRHNAWSSVNNIQNWGCGSVTDMLSAVNSCHLLLYNMW